jgi:hypothetical protein
MVAAAVNITNLFANPINIFLGQSLAGWKIQARSAKLLRYREALTAELVYVNRLKMQWDEERTCFDAARGQFLS